MKNKTKKNNFDNILNLKTDWKKEYLRISNKNHFK